MGSRGWTRTSNLPLYGFPSTASSPDAPDRSNGNPVPMSSPSDWNASMAGYLLMLKASNRSPHTIRMYRHYLAVLARRHQCPWVVSTADLRLLLTGSGWGPESMKSARTVWRGFYKWAYGESHTPYDPAAGLDPVKVPAASPRPAPESAVAVIDCHPDPRVRLMGMLAAHVGLRCAEVACVHCDDLVGDWLRVHGKGGKVRTVPVVHPVLLDRLQQVDGWAFPNGHGDHLSPGHVTRLLSAALPDGWTGHTLRHRCATVAYSRTHNLLAVGRALGHSRPETTQRYVALPDEDLRAVMTAAA